jgi:hypothetical protein
MHATDVGVDGDYGAFPGGIDGVPAGCQGHEREEDPRAPRETPFRVRHRVHGAPDNARLQATDRKSVLKYFPVASPAPVRIPGPR